MPGISDPNMSSAVWERMMPFADGVLWCSPATQAWRQSEAAVWDSLDPSIYKRSLMVLTRGDMLLTEQDKAKVMRRVRGEAGDKFADILMVSLSLARDAGDDEELWEKSGADAFVARYLDLLSEISQALEASGGAPLQSARPLPGRDTVCPEQGDAAGAVRPKRPVVRRAMGERPSDTSDQKPDPASYMPKFS
jgi:hypothetical protein